MRNDVRKFLKGLVADADMVEAVSFEDLTEWVKANGRRAEELLTGTVVVHRQAVKDTLRGMEGQ